MANNANYQRILRETAEEATRQAQANENAQMAAALAASTVNENRRANRQFAANIAATVIVAKAEGAAGAKADILNLMRTGGGGKHLAPAKREILLRVAAVDDVMISLHPMDQGLKNSLFGLLNALLKGIDDTIPEAELIEALQVADGDVIYNQDFNPHQGHLAEGAIFRDIAAVHEELKVQDKADEKTRAANLQKLIKEHAAQMARDAATAKRLEAEKKAKSNAAMKARYGGPPAPLRLATVVENGKPPGSPNGKQVDENATPPGGPVRSPVRSPVVRNTVAQGAPKSNNFGAMLPQAAVAKPNAAPTQQPNAAERRRRMAEAAAARMKGGKTRRRKLRSGSRKRLNVHRRDRR